MHILRLQSTAQHSTAQHSTAHYITAQHSTAQHSTAQHSTAQHSTAHAFEANYRIKLLTARVCSKLLIIARNCTYVRAKIRNCATYVLWIMRWMIFFIFSKIEWYRLITACTVCVLFTFRWPKNPTRAHSVQNTCMDKPSYVPRKPSWRSLHNCKIPISGWKTRQKKTDKCVLRFGLPHASQRKQGVNNQKRQGIIKRRIATITRPGKRRNGATHRHSFSPTKCVTKWMAAYYYGLSARIVTTKTSEDARERALPGKREVAAFPTYNIWGGGSFILYTECVW